MTPMIANTRRKQIEELIDADPMEKIRAIDGGVFRNFVIEKVEWLMDVHHILRPDPELVNLAQMAFDLRVQIDSVETIRGIRIDVKSLLACDLKSKRLYMEIEPGVYRHAS
jgi:hypothetical protein